MKIYFKQFTENELMVLREKYQKIEIKNKLAEEAAASLAMLPGRSQQLQHVS